MLVDQGAKLLNRGVVCRVGGFRRRDARDDFYGCGMFFQRLGHQGIVSECLAHLWIEDFFLQLRVHRQCLADALRQRMFGCGWRGVQIRIAFETVRCRTRREKNWGPSATFVGGKLQVASSYVSDSRHPTLVAAVHRQNVCTLALAHGRPTPPKPLQT